MTRTPFALPLLLALAPAAAQDMPLSQILIDGEGWKDAGRAGTPAEQGLLAARRAKARATGVDCSAASPDAGVLYVGREGGRFILAAQVGADGDPSRAVARPYCPLRIKRGGTAGGVTALTVDRDGRVYAATPLGVQVFDPTGRLCGVITAPAGKVEDLAFDGDRLVAWVGDVRYARKLRPTGK